MVVFVPLYSRGCYVFTSVVSTNEWLLRSALQFPWFYFCAGALGPTLFYLFLYYLKFTLTTQSTIKQFLRKSTYFLRKHVGKMDKNGFEFIRINLLSYFFLRNDY